ncbi:YlbD family protein [Virgibacillus siamensis]|uniref:YlbD family protein n=1 Tax=Virgibacillus siamensis TaxID=480071 RepID=UPI00098774AD|nr:spore coat protein YlbD [Virgibacillus siamensis]
MHDVDLDPSVKEFKTFMNNHPKLIEEVRRNGREWQEYYEKWALLDEDDPFWDEYKERNRTGGKHPEFFSKMMDMTEKMDAEKVQKQVKQLNQTISIIQEMLGKVQNNRKPTQPFGNINNPFNWNRD